MDGTAHVAVVTPYLVPDLETLARREWPLNALGESRLLFVEVAIRPLVGVLVGFRSDRGKLLHNVFLLININLFRNLKLC